MVEAGNLHEEIGPSPLVKHGFSENYVRFARTRGQWEQSSDIEDLLVALADKVWKGTRNKDLEQKIVQRIASACDDETWDVYLKLDDLLRAIADRADERLLWYGKQPL